VGLIRHLHARGLRLMSVQRVKTAGM
jgi:hypothetical protein